MVGDSFVYLTKGRREWLTGRYVSCTWNIEVLTAKKGPILREEKVKVELVL